MKHGPQRFMGNTLKSKALWGLLEEIKAARRGPIGIGAASVFKGHSGRLAAAVARDLSHLTEVPGSYGPSAGFRIRRNDRAEQSPRIGGLLEPFGGAG